VLWAAPDHSLIRPTDGSGKYAGQPATFRAQRHAYGLLPMNIENMWEYSGSGVQAAD